jgi:DNA-directed RNA polymerase specialized sigma24 family protein
MRRGDRAAFLAFYDLHAAPVLGFLASVPDACQEPEEALADVFTTALLTSDPCPRTTVEAWLLGIAREQTRTSALRVALRVA